MAGFDGGWGAGDPGVFAEALGERFKLSGQEMQRAIEAFAPAFALGFQKATGDPAAFADLAKAFQAVTPGLFAGTPSPFASPPFASPLFGNPFFADREGDLLVKAFFGSDALASAVARQASLFSGIAPDTLTKLIPGLAVLNLQAMARGAMETLARTAPEGLASGDLGAASAEMMRRGANALEALSRPSGARSPGTGLPEGGMATLFADALKAPFAFMPGAAPAGAEPAKTPRSGRPGVDPMAPFAAMLDAFSRTLGTAAPGAKPPAERPAAPKTGDAERADALRDGYAREMAALFERFGGTRRAG